MEKDRFGLEIKKNQLLLPDARYKIANKALFESVLKPMREGDEDDPKLTNRIDKYEDHQYLLDSLNKEKTLEAVQKNPKKISEALAFLISCKTLENSEGDGVDRQKIAGELFNEVAGKVYPRIVEAKKMNVLASFINEGVKLFDVTSVVEALQGLNLEESDPDRLQEMFDKVFSTATVAIEDFIEDERDLSDEELVEIERVVRTVYRVEMARDDLSEKTISKQIEHGGRKRRAEHEAVVKKSETRDRVETKEVKEKMLLDEISREGAILMNTSVRGDTSFPDEISRGSGSGFQSLYDKKRAMFDTGTNALNMVGMQMYEVEFSNMSREESLNKYGISELVAIEPEMEDIYEMREVEIPGKFFGIGKRKEKKRTKIGEKSKGFANLVPGGKNEPACRFTYCATAEGLDFAGGDNRYQDYSSRDGQYMVVDVLLPESLAKDLSEKLVEDPSFARRLVEKLAKDNIGVEEDLWREGKGNNGFPLRPPYEKWSKNGGGKTNMYLETPWDKPKSKKVTDNVVEIKI